MVLCCILRYRIRWVRELVCQIGVDVAHTVTGKHRLRLGPGQLYWNLSEQGSTPVGVHDTGR